MSDNQTPRTRRFLAIAYMAAAQSGSVAWTKFAGWTVAGFGAAALLVLTQTQTIAASFDASWVKVAVALYLGALAAAVLEKFIATYVAAATSGAEALQGRFGEQLEESELRAAFEDLKASAIGIQRVLARIIVKHNADEASVPRFVFRLAAIQAHLSIAIVVIEILAVTAFLAGYHKS
jgi:hypothetical protein